MLYCNANKRLIPLVYCTVTLIRCIYWLTPAWLTHLLIIRFLITATSDVLLAESFFPKIAVRDTSSFWLMTGTLDIGLLM